MTTASGRSAGRKLLGGVLWNVAGRGLPLAVALLLTPLLVHQLGLERWGLFTLALAVVGVFSIFDFGIGQALTRALSERIGAGDTHDSAAVVSTALAFLTAIGVLGGILLWLLMPLLVERVLKVPAGLQTEAIDGLRVLAFAVPLVVYNASLWGVLAAYQRYRAANLVNIPVSIMYYLGPVLVLLVWDNLMAVMLTLLACRAANTVSYALLVRPILPGIGLRQVQRELLPPLLRIGGWMSLGSMLTQALLYADRFLIGAVLSLTAVAFYATSLDLVMRFWVAPVAIINVMLPALSSTWRTEPAVTVRTLRRGTIAMLVIVAPACLLLVGFAGPLLTLWLGAEFAAGATRVLQVLGIGILFSCVAYGPGCMVEAIGRPDVLARFTLAQAALFLPLSLLLLLQAGIEGAAVAWAVRCACDCGGRLYIAARLYPPARPAMAAMLQPLALATAGLLALLPLHSPWTAAVVVTVAGLLFGLGLLRALDQEDAARLRRKLPLPAALFAGGH